MTKNRSLTALFVVAVAVVVLAGGLMASNMGFKLNKSLVTASPGTSISGTQLLALPYNRQVGIDNASELFGDIGASNVQNIQKFLTATDTTALYTFGSPDFALTPGEAYLVKMAQTLAFSPSHY